MNMEVQSESRRRSRADAKIALKSQLKEAGEDYLTEEDKEETEKLIRFESIKDKVESIRGKGPIAVGAVKISDIDYENNVRWNIDTESSSFKRFLNSIEKDGIIQKVLITVGKTPDKPFHLIGGHRRLKAWMMLGNTTIEPILVHTDDAKGIERMRFAENFHRENLKPIELAESVGRQRPFYGSTKECAEELGLSRQYTTELCKIYSWPPEAKELAFENEIPASVLSRIAKRTLTDQQIFEKLEEYVQEQKLALEVTDDTSLQNDSSDSDARASETQTTSRKKENKGKASENGRYINRRDTYFERNGLSEPERKLICDFLEKNKIKGWF